MSLKAYVCPAGKLTIGYGHTQTVTKGMKITREQAEDLLKQDAIKFYNCVMEHVGSVCKNNQIGALTSFAYNLGTTNFEQSTLLKVIKANPKNFVEIRKQFNRWIYAGRTMLKGLQKRRSAEAELYCR